MYIEIFELDENNLSKYSREDIKRIYKKIALECHPDKLVNISNEEIKNNKIEKFKKAGIAYKMALDHFDSYGSLINTSSFTNFEYDFSNFDKEFYNNYDFNIFTDIYNDFIYDNDNIKNAFMNIANSFLKKGVHNRKYYNPSTNIIKHSIVLPIKYHDLYNNKKKKLQILLKGVEEPINISLVCKKEYPVLTRQYIDDNGNEHEVEIKMILSENTNIEDKTFFHHKFRKNGTIDLITSVEINLYEYLAGAVKVLKYIDCNYMNIEINSFDLNEIILKNKGLLGGDLVVNIVFKNIKLSEWNKISHENREIIKNILMETYEK